MVEFAMKLLTTFEQAEAYLSELQRFGIKLGLENTRELLARAGSPERGLRFIHIAGTNGKGSTGAMLERALRGAGLKTGFYSSPHLIAPGERIRVHGRALTDEQFLTAMNTLAPEAEAMRRNGACPTYFEWMTVMAARVFADAGCEIVIWETGMGGRFDATNVVTPEVAVITGIALDHQQYLGDTLEKIASEKAGIIKPGRPVVVGVMPEAPRAVIAARARELAEVEFVDAGQVNIEPLGCGADADGVWSQRFRLDGLPVTLPLAGAMQRRNAAVAVTVLRKLGERLAFDFRTAVTALAHTRWPARAGLTANGAVLVDGGHNPDGLAALVETLNECWPQRKFDWIFGAFADKDAVGGLRLIVPLARKITLVAFAEGARRSVAPEVLRDVLLDTVTAVTAESLSAALAVNDLTRIQEGGAPGLVLAGSLYMAGEALEKLEPRDGILNL